MANQMVALGVRGPQMPNLAGMTQQYGQILNVLAQQRAAERQGALAQQNIAQTQQQMDFAAAKREEERRAAGQTFDVAEMARLRNLGTAVNNEDTYQAWLSEVEKADPRSAAMFRQASPTYNPQFMLNVIGEADDYIRARVPTATAQTMLGAGGGAFNVVAGAPDIASATPVTVSPAQSSTPPNTDRQPATVEEAFSDTPTAGAPARVRPPSNIPSGNPLQRPISMMSGGEGPASLTVETAAPIIQTAVQNGSIGETDLQALRQMVGPQMEPQLAQWMQQNNIRITPEGQSAMRSAVYRPGQDAAPQMTQVQSNAPGTQFFGRDPMQSPSQVPSSAGAVSGATTAASEGVRVETQPRIRAGEERAVRLERLRDAAPQARGDVDALLSNSAQRVQAIDRMLRDRSYEGIVGSIQGRIPRVLQTENMANAQRLLDTITNTDVIQDIIASRAQTETGGSPLGNVSNSDLQMYVNAANALAQTGSEEEFRRELIRMRQQLVGGMDRARRTYEDTFRPLGDEMSNMRLTAPAVPRSYSPQAPQRRAPAAPRTTRGGAAVSNW